MAGYYKMPEQTHTAIDSEGWLHTRDLAMMNAHGHLTIVGRLKEVVIRGGENIFPREVEEFLLPCYVPFYTARQHQSGNCRVGILPNTFQIRRFASQTKPIQDGHPFASL